MRYFASLIQGSTGKARRGERGFSLIELGIVIAVIAVLATVVIFGRGFIAAGRVTKGVDAALTIRKAAATTAGIMGGRLTGGQNQLQVLAERGLISELNGGEWYVSGSPDSQADAVRVTSVDWDQQDRDGIMSNIVGIQFNVPTNTMGLDLQLQVRDDPNVAWGRTASTLNCSDGSEQTQAPVLCFWL